MKTQSKEPVNPSPNPGRRKFDPIFKQEAVSLWLSSGRSAAEVGEELGIRPERLFHWRKTFAPATPGGKGGAGATRTAAQLAEENLALRRDNERLRQQRDILKKTLGIISELPNNATSGLTR